MTTDVKNIEPDLRMIEMALLRESAGCSYEDQLVRTFNYGMLSGVILHCGALAKRLIGLWGIAIGNDPRRDMMPGVSQRDWSDERAKIDRDDNPHREIQLRELQQDIERAQNVASLYDAEAWNKVIELEEIIKRRAMALARMDPPLLEYAVDDWLPDEVMATEKNLGNPNPSIPNENSVQITRDGLRFLASGKRLIPKKNKRYPSRFDDDLAIEGEEGDQ